MYVRDDTQLLCSTADALLQSMSQEPVLTESNLAPCG